MSEHSKEGIGTLGKVLIVASVWILAVVLLISIGVFGVRLMAAMIGGGDAPDAELAAIMPSASAPAAPSPAPAEATPSEGGGDDTASAPAPAPGDGGAGPVDDELMATGKQTYNTLCIACHGPDGKGAPNNMAPSLAGSEWVSGPTERLATLVLNGIQPEGRFVGVMVPWKGLMSDEQIAGVLTYVRNSFGNNASAVTPEQVAWAREKHGDAATSPTRAELESLKSDLPEQ